MNSWILFCSIRIVKKILCKEMFLNNYLERKKAMMHIQNWTLFVCVFYNIYQNLKEGTSWKCISIQSETKMSVTFAFKCGPETKKKKKRTWVHKWNCIHHKLIHKNLHAYMMTSHLAPFHFCHTHHVCIYPATPLKTIRTKTFKLIDKKKQSLFFYLMP